MSLRDRLRPWHGLMLAVFCIGAGSALADAERLALGTVMPAVLTGLFGVVVFQFTVGNVWASAVEYRNAGGRWTDLAFLAPFGVSLAVTVAFFVLVTDRTLGGVASALWVGVLVFAVAIAVTALVAQVVLGYRESSQPAG